ncbi:MAG: NusA-like transcription termination signal-binding factor [Candidatus Undinarchaeales archaeon]|nr:NusA-like transcription termination signal-binding factor [Candidatus Undinarchaeales archaeon]MDP7494251.1 NusA-like transcription termination signal-binding factor [Candidatus Undinarchaeales archaeon]
MARARIKLTAELIRYISVFERLTGATVKDCFLEGKSTKLVFIVNEGVLGLAIGKKGANIKRVKMVLEKELDVIEYSKDPLQFIRNLLRPMKPQNVYLSEKSDGQKVVNLTLENKEKRFLLAKQGERLNKVREIMRRHYEFDLIEVR